MPTVLVIDDNDELRETLALLLEDEGYIAIAAGDGRAGILAFEQARPDLVVTDVIMPDCDGIEAIRRIRAIDPHTRVIAISGGSMFGNDCQLRKAKDIGAMAVLQKPFDVDELMREIGRCLRASRTDNLPAGPDRATGHGG